MSWHKIKRFPADIAWSEYIRRTDKKCQFSVSKNCESRVLRDYETGNVSIEHLDCVHIFSRGKWSTRFDRRNTFAGCRKCHKAFHDGRADIEEWYKGKFGEQEFNKLLIDSNTTIRDKQSLMDMVKLFCKKELETLRKE